MKKYAWVEVPRRKYDNSHKTRTLHVAKCGGRIYVDVQMAPFILWLNSLPDVRTHYCCQGNEGKKPRLGFPHVVVGIQTLEAAKFILGLTEQWMKGAGIGHRNFMKRREVDYLDMEEVRINLVWRSKSDFRRWLRWLKRQRHESSHLLGRLAPGVVHARRRQHAAGDALAAVGGIRDVRP